MEGGEGQRRVRSSAAADGGLKKGPWSAVEDEILVEYVKRHGEGNWNAVQRNSGLMRCGKSCRLRWANHLRPNLKKGSFSPEEEKLIIELHAKLGNKWARMASQLPGRTDNEIKNYWNTRLKRRQRAGLPLYPQDLHLQHENHRVERHHYGGRERDSLPEVAFSSFLNLPQKHQLMEIPAPPHPRPVVYPSDQFAAGVPFSSFYDPSSVGVTSFLLFGQHLPTTDLHTPPSSNYHLQLDSGGFDCISAVTTHQLQMVPTTHSSSSSSGFVGPCGGDAVEDSDDVIVGHSNSGLLGDVLKESVALKQKNWAQDRSPAPEATKGKEVAGQSSTGLMKRIEQGSVKMVEEDMKNYMDDELLSLLNSFPAAAPLPDWYPRSGDELSPNNCNRNHDQWTTWNNMPGFCTTDESREVLHFL